MAIVNGLVGPDGSSDEEWKLGWNRNDIGWWFCTDLENRYYYTADNGWKEINGEWYIFDSRGYALQDAWYYLNDECKMVRGSNEKVLWKWIDSACYAFDEMGRMYCDCITYDGWRVDKNGEWKK
ncbi:autolysin [Clostridium saccharoperbutylacetonicum]|nr:autolysin [Clostridium saccharoperbutylacetonicum]NSB34505.1 glucan-binding YG repeat protein [Clostridium saccharoperbutylacetonicum]